MRFLVVLGLLLPGACAPSPAPDRQARLLEIATEYPGYKLASRAARWSPTLCTGPAFGLGPPPGRISASVDEGTHGRKLYYLHAKDDLAYARGGGQPVGQVLVKEAWTPKELAEAEVLKATEEGHRKFELFKYDKLPPGETWTGMPVRSRGKHYEPGGKVGLFVMYKLDPRTEGTDAGWVYGTVSADGRSVTSSGRIESCMSCHQDAKTDRIFGLPPAPE